MKKNLIALAIAAAVLASASGSANAHLDERIAASASRSAPAAPMSKIPARFQAGGLQCSDAFFYGRCRTKQHCLRGCDAIFEVETIICAATSSTFAGCFAAASTRWRMCITECEEEFPF